MKKRFVILGGGESGVGAALLAQKAGYDVFVSDESSLKDNYRNDLRQAAISFKENGHDLDKVMAADEIMKSPGIPEKNETVKKIRKAGNPHYQ